MKRGTPEHPKTLALAETLGVPWAHSVGLLECLWHWTARYAPRGDVGRFPDSSISRGAKWEGDPARFVAALIECNWLDASEEHRLLVHDWQDHCDDATKKHLSRADKSFASAPQKRLGAKPSVYLIQAQDSKRIKIGHTETTVQARLDALQTGCPERLLILCSFPGTHRDERTLHSKFFKSRLAGEWFTPTEDILTFVRERQTTSANGKRRRPAVALPEPLPLPEPEPLETTLRLAPPLADGPPQKTATAWNREAADDYKAVYKADPTEVFFAQVKPVAKQYGWARTRPALRAYMEATPIEFLNVAKCLAVKVEGGPSAIRGKPATAERNDAVIKGWAQEVREGKR